MSSYIRTGIVDRKQNNDRQSPYTAVNAAVASPKSDYFDYVDYVVRLLCIVIVSIVMASIAVANAV